MRRREQIFPLDISKLEDVLGKILANVQGVRGGNLFPPYPIPTPLFRKKRIEINFFVQQNTSKFAIFIEKENPCSFFSFFI